jgi:hypothetical protein
MPFAEDTYTPLPHRTAGAKRRAARRKWFAALLLEARELLAQSVLSELGQVLTGGPKDRVFDRLQELRVDERVVPGARFGRDLCRARAPCWLQALRSWRPLWERPRLSVEQGVEAASYSTKGVASGHAASSCSCSMSSSASAR